MNAESTVRSFIERNFLVKKGIESIANDESLLVSGLIDSTAIFELVAFLENEFGIEVRDEDVIPENFETLDNILKYVHSRKQG